MWPSSSPPKVLCHQGNKKKKEKEKQLKGRGAGESSILKVALTVTHIAQDLVTEPRLQVKGVEVFIPRRPLRNSEKEGKALGGRQMICLKSFVDRL